MKTYDEQSSLHILILLLGLSLDADTELQCELALYHEKYFTNNYSKLIINQVTVIDMGKQLKLSL